MFENITLEQYPLWYAGFCLLLGALFALLLYFRDRTFKEASDAQRRWLLPIALFRMLTVSAIAFLLLKPLIKSRFLEVVKPLVIVAHDNSESVGAAFAKSDSSAYMGALRNVVDQFGEDYEVHTHNFGTQLSDGLTMDFKQKSTNIASALEEISDTYNGQNVGAIILATDGIYNQGSSPLYSKATLDVPLYAVALGDTTTKKDLILDKVLHNRIAYLNDQFTIRVDMHARNCAGASTKLTVTKDGAQVFGKTLSFTKADEIITEDVILDAKSPGMSQYTIRVSEVNGEVSTKNNRQDIYVEVLDNRRKVLILGANPHPDLSAIKSAIETNDNYETVVSTPDRLKNNVKDFDLAILHGLPSSKGGDGIIQQLKDNGTPLWFILAESTNIAAFNKAQRILKVEGTKAGSQNQVKAKGKSGFNLFTISDQLLPELQELPPLVAPFGKFQSSPTAQVLLKQRIGSVDTEYPLLSMEQSTGDKVAVLAAEGLWRWRIYDYKKDRTNERFGELINKVVQYLSVKNDKRKFRVNMPKTLFNENEPISFDAELYNDSYELINDPDVSLTIYDVNEKAYPYTFNRSGNAYNLDAGFFPVGKYRYAAKTVYNGQEYTANGSFSIRAVQLESLQTTANHQLLYSLTERFGGAVIYPDSLASLNRVVGKLPATQYSTYKTRSMMNIRWIFLGLALLLAIEWFIRKFLGGY